MPGVTLSLAASGSSWAVATPHTAATEAAVCAFTAGGNAIDAALAAATMLTVAYPHMCGVGGDLIALVRDPAGQVRTIMSTGAAPAATDVQAVRARHGGAMPTHGPDAITVPGAVAGWQATHDLGARLSWQDALLPAVAAARDGVQVAPDLAATLAWGQTRFRSDPGLSQVFFPDGRPPAAGELVRQAALATTLDTLARVGPAALYGGDLGRAYADGLNGAGSPLAPEDLSDHRADVLAPLRKPFRGYQIVTAPPPSQGFLLQLILSAIGSLDLDPDPLGADADTMAALFARASAVRHRSLADPRYMPTDVRSLLDAGLAPAGPGPNAPSGTGDTISLVTADAHGWAVSLIQSLYDAFGSGILEPVTGIIAHDRGACFTLEPGHPNELAPGKRPAHTLMPVMVERDGALEAVAGTMGGEAQPQINAENLLRILACRATPADALAAPRWTVEGSTATVEADVPRHVRDALTGSGLQLDPAERHDGALGHSNLIVCNPDGFGDAALLEAAADPRADGSAHAG